MEGDDDRRVLEKIIRSGNGKFAFSPCVVGSVNELSKWEMRVGSHRVFYDVDEEANQVTIKAVGWKEHNNLFIRGKAYQL